jgi:hypothetical protein
MRTAPQCKSCKYLSEYGIKEGGHIRWRPVWCCKFGKPSYKAIGECKLKGGFSPTKEIKP